MNQENSADHYSNPEQWLKREAGGDATLEHLFEQKEHLMDSESSVSPTNPVLQSLNDQIRIRQEQLNIDPISDPYTPYVPGN